MKTKREKAIDNNHGLYEAVFGLGGLSWKKTASIWYSTGKVPPLHSNLVTRAPDWKPDQAFETIDSAGRAQGWEGWSIKDSFRTLHLEDRGFAVLFDARWLYLEAAQFLPLPGPKFNYTVARDARDLAVWRSAWEKHNGVRAETIYPDAIVHDPDVFFVIGRDDAGRVASLCLLNTTDDVVGISNFFPPEDGVAASWTDLISYIQREFGETDVVGYEGPELLSALQPLGIEAVGDLCIWVKNRKKDETARF